MTFALTLEDAQEQFPDYTFVKALTPSAQKAAFHVRDRNDNDLCLKIVAPTYERDRLDREILAMQTIDHPNVVHLSRVTHGLLKTGVQQRHFIVEEFVDVVRSCGLTMRLGQPWALQEAVQFFANVVRWTRRAQRGGNRSSRALSPRMYAFAPTGPPLSVDFRACQAPRIA